MSDRDNELDKILKPLADMKPNAQQMARWQALASNQRPKSWWAYQALQLTAAAFIGFVIAALYFKNHQNNQEVVDNFDPTATIEMLYSKSE